MIPRRTLIRATGALAAGLSPLRALADTVTVLQSGQVLAEGTYEQVRNDERVITAYLGQAGDAHV